MQINLSCVLRGRIDSKSFDSFQAIVPPTVLAVVVTLKDWAHAPGCAMPLYYWIVLFVTKFGFQLFQMPPKVGCDMSPIIVGGSKKGQAATVITVRPAL